MAGKVATSVFASYAPASHPKYVVVVMIPDAGFGADVSAPAVRQIWDGMYGLEGHQAALPGGNLPPLPYINGAGQLIGTSAATGRQAGAHPSPAQTPGRRP